MTVCRGGKRERQRPRGGWKKTGGNTFRQSGISDREVYRVTQLIVSGTVFVLLVAVKLLFPKQMDLVREPLGQALEKNMDIAQVFAAVGNVVSGEWEDHAVYQAVFGHQGDEGDIADEEEQEHTKPDFVDDDKEATIIYADANLPDGVNLQQVVLGFDYCTPVAGSISSYFGYRKNPVGASDRFHYGLDIAAEEEAEIVSFADGVVTVTAESSSYGKYVIVKHDNNCTTLYAHCDQLYAVCGQTVRKGEKIASVGDSGQTTGPHLHFELQQNDVYLNPVYYVL